MTGNFKYHTKRSFDNEYDYKEILSVIERIKSRCQEYEIHETFGGHPTKAFDGMSVPLNDNEKHINDKYFIFRNSADNLLELNKEISGEYGWNKVADVVSTKSGIGVDDYHWTLNTYKLKPEYSQLLINSLNDLEKEIRTNYENYLAEQKSMYDKREAIKQSILSIDTSKRPVIDEGGKTEIYTHTITFNDGEELTFSEQNVFDVGIVISPLYCVSDGLKPGALCLKCDGRLQWHKFVSNEGWIPVRPLTENEITAMEYLRVFGGFSGHGIRMQFTEK